MNIILVYSESYGVWCSDGAACILTLSKISKFHSSFYFLEANLVVLAPHVLYPLLLRRVCSFMLQSRIPNPHVFSFFIWV